MPKTIAYVVSRFPKLTETFILYEMLALEQLGLQIELFPLLRQKETVQHPAAAPFVARAHIAQPWSLAVWRDQLYWLAAQPKSFLLMWRDVLWGNRQSPKFLGRAIVAGLLGGWFARQMLRQHVDHIHAHWATHAALAAYVVHRLTGIPYSFTAHAHDIYVEQSMLAEKIRAAAVVVTISQHNLRFLRDLYGDELAGKVQVIRCGVDTAVFQPRPAHQTNTPFTLICVGSLEEKKGQRYLLEACALLAAHNVPLRCWFVGDGPERPSLSAQITAAGLTDSVKLLGQQTREQVSTLLSTADLMVLPSVRLPNGKQEGIPVALMEALAVGLPAIASNLSGISELIIDNQTGLLVPERDPAALAAAIQKVIADPEWARQLGTNGRRHVLQTFDLNRNAAQLAQLLQQDWHKPTTAQAALTPGEIT